MGSENKNQYEAPTTLVFVVTQERMVCASPKFNKPFNDEEEW